MPDHAIIALGGLLCGLLAGAAAQHGRLCTFAAIEDALVAGDLRRARAWALALAVAIAGSQALIFTGQINPLNAFHSAGRIELASLLLGAVLFGLGMALVGTCGFGLLVRGGTGDLRALLMALLLGIAAFAATAGPLAGPRVWLAGAAVVDLGGSGAGTLTGLAEAGAGRGAAAAIAVLVPLGLAAFALASDRVRGRWRLIVAAIVLGVAVTGGWIVTGVVADPFSGQRLESLTFVGPVGRLVLVLMGESLAAAGFAVASVVGVVAGSFLVALLRRELRWEAFDDQREMRRHILGAVLMGIGGVLARGCTIGQGLSAGSLLAVTAPMAVLGMVLGARIGLAWLLDGSVGRGRRAAWTRRNGA